MKCPTCGTRLEANARFCGACGHNLVAAPSANVPAAGRPVSAQVAPADPFIGKTLNNRFAIESKLGEGGFGAVYKGTQSGTGRVVAIKLLHPEMTRDSNLLERFRREGLVLCNLRDAHTITTYDFDQTPDGTFYIAMELLEGKSLHDVFHSEPPVAWKRMLKIVSQMCSSLAEAHAQGIIHRDLKPENIHLENRPGNPEFVKILDFGIAKLSGDGGIGGGQSPQLTATGQTLGTLEYMSPEQLMGKPLDGRSDVYAVGVVAYELMTGRLPFPDAKGPAQLITAQLKQTPEPPSRALPTGGIPPAVDACILRMLEKDKNNRFADVTELRQEVDRIIATGGQQTPAPSASAPQPQPQHHTPQPQQHTPQQPQQHTPPPRPHTPPPAQQQAPQLMGYHPSQGGGPSTQTAMAATRGSRLWLWLALAIVAIGGAVGAALALS